MELRSLCLARLEPGIAFLFQGNNGAIESQVFEEKHG